jgi:BirA family biotin operon repressor/biotin-[acetyl-CoA-carboxylase] ligase
MNEPAFSAARFQRELNTDVIGRYVVYRAITESTMILARREADEGAPHGTLVLAEEQTAGRGRRARSFYSPAAENLYFTLVLRLPVAEHRRLPLVVPVAVCEAIRDEGVDAGIKWPNDIWVGELKVCGMLIDAELRADGALAMPGIGINVNGDPAANPELAGIATSIARAAGRAISRESLLARVCDGLDRWLASPGKELSYRYRELSVILGRAVTVHPSAGDAWHGVAESVDEDGGLCVRSESGHVETVLAADVSIRPRQG